MLIKKQVIIIGGMPYVLPSREAIIEKEKTLMDFDLIPTLMLTSSSKDGGSPHGFLSIGKRAQWWTTFQL